MYVSADDMGLGKTLSMISLVLKSEENQDCVPVVSNDNNRNDRKIWFNENENKFKI